MVSTAVCSHRNAAETAMKPLTTHEKFCLKNAAHFVAARGRTPRDRTRQQFAILPEAQIDTLAQRLSETPIALSASAKKAGDALARLLAERIGINRAALAFTSIMTAATAEQAAARLTLVLDYGNTEPAGELISVMAEEPEAAITPAIGKRQAIIDQVQTGALPLPPDFSKPTHARFRAKLAQIVVLAEAGDIAALQAFEINPVSSSPKAMARYRDLSVIAITARTQVAA